MASSVLKMKPAAEGDKFELFAARYGRLVIAVTAMLVSVAVAAIVFVSVRARRIDDGLSQVYEITYRLQADAKNISGAELDARRAAAIEELSALTSATGIVGARANMLAADLSYQNKKYAEAVSYWERVVALQPKSYTAQLALYNTAAACESLGENQKAADLYKQVSETKDFRLASHAGFNAGRIHEALDDYAGAVELYNKILNDNPFDTWAELGHSRVIYIEANHLSE